MARQLISSGGKWEEILGYSRAVVDGEWVFLAGTGGLASGAAVPMTVRQVVPLGVRADMIR